MFETCKNCANTAGTVPGLNLGLIKQLKHLDYMYNRGVLTVIDLRIEQVEVLQLVQFLDRSL